MGFLSRFRSTVHLASIGAATRLTSSGKKGKRAMTDRTDKMQATSGTHRGRRADPLGLGRLWQAFIRRRDHRMQMECVQHLDDFMRRDVGLPPRATPVRQVYYQW